MMPWVHMHVTQYGTVTPCCQTPWEEEKAFGNINRQSIEQIWNGKPISDFRLNMLEDKADDRCKRCYEKEKAGLYSLRIATNKDYMHHLKRVNATDKIGNCPNTQPVYFDIRFSNFCNFKCRICGPWSSNSWFNDARIMGMNPNSLRLTKAIEDEDGFFAVFKNYLPFTEEIYFAGGEPMLMEQHYRVLDMLLEMGLTKTYLRYNTNFSTFEFRGKSIFDYWKKFENIFLCASLDGTGKQGELQRKGQEWNDVVNKRKQLLAECPHIDFMLAPTVSVLNAMHLPDFHKEWTELGLIDVCEIFPSILEEPGEYNIKIFPKHIKQAIEEKYKEHYDWMMGVPSKDEERKELVANEFLKCVKFMWNEDLSENLPAFKKVTQQLDEIRNENTFDVIPELKVLNKE
ncbi:MAG: hypothetical protein JWO06_1429 [Bacteroidota bacterium]|nr:hypothetical protein [Bacteroidota bacterium]